MANTVFNVSLGRVIELYQRVKGNDPATSTLVVVPLETSGLESDAVLQDKDDLAAILSGTTNEQTALGRKTFSDAALAALAAPDDTGDIREASLPTFTWTAGTGNPVSKLVVCYDANAGADSALVPLTMFDFVVTPDTTDIQVNAGPFFRAGH